MLEAYYSLFQAVGVERGVGLTVRDLLRDETHFLADIGLSRTARTGDVFATRVIPLQEQGFLMSGGAGLPVTIRALARISKTLDRAFDRATTDFTRLTPDQESDLAAPVIRVCLESGMSSRIAYGTAAETSSRRSGRSTRARSGVPTATTHARAGAAGSSNPVVAAGRGSSVLLRSIMVDRRLARSPKRGRSHQPTPRRGARRRAEGDAVDAVARPAQGQHLAAAGRVPDPDGLIGAGGGNPRSIGAERHAHDPVGVALERVDQTAGLRHPSSESSRSAPAETNRVPSGLNATPKTALEWPSSDDAQLTRRRVPDPDDPVGAGGSEPGAVGAEREGVDRTGVAPQRADLRRRSEGFQKRIVRPSSSAAGNFARRCLDHRGRRSSARGQHVAVGAERDTGQPLAQVREHQRRPASFKVPDPDVSIRPGRRQASALAIVGQGDHHSPAIVKLVLQPAGGECPRLRWCDSFPPPPARFPTVETPRLQPSVRPCGRLGWARGRLAVSLELEPTHARLGSQVPELDGRVLAGRDQLGSVGAEGDLEQPARRGRRRRRSAGPWRRPRR